MTSFPHKNPAACPHNEACWKPGPTEGTWLYSCPCGLVGFGVTLEDARRVFREKAAKRGRARSKVTQRAGALRRAPAR